MEFLVKFLLKTEVHVDDSVSTTIARDQDSNPTVCPPELAAGYRGRTIPESDLLMAILLPSSLFHLTLGGGDPVA
jgi:hypothetical protein